MTQPTAAPFVASEVRSWLREQDAEVGTRGRISLALHLGYLQGNEERAVEVGRQLGTLPASGVHTEESLAATADLMAHPKKLTARRLSTQLPKAA